MNMIVTCPATEIGTGNETAWTIAVVTDMTATAIDRGTATGTVTDGTVRATVTEQGTTVGTRDGEAGPEAAAVSATGTDPETETETETGIEIGTGTIPTAAVVGSGACRLGGTGTVIATMDEEEMTAEGGVEVAVRSRDSESQPTASQPQHQLTLPWPQSRVKRPQSQHPPW